MSHPRPRKPRPLGSLRHITKNVPDKQLPTIPKLLPEISPDSEKLKEGIHGNAMTVPPPPSESSSRRESIEDRPKSDKKPPKSSVSSESAVSHENCEKEIKHGLNREKELKDLIAALQKEIAELRVALEGKTEINNALQARLLEQETELTDLLNAERTAHLQTKSTLLATQDEVVEANDRIGRLMEEHRVEMETLRGQLELRLTETIESKDALISDREQKMARLKAQMADALKGNSWERQQQLEELTKELSRIQEESDLLRMKIKTMGKNKQSKCDHCEEANNKLTKLQAVVKEREETIKDLKSMCVKFETQLSTQDKLLEQWATSKGQKITAPK